jgi:hypothetical protein
MLRRERPVAILVLATAACALGLVLVLAAAAVDLVVLTAVFSLLCVLLAQPPVAPFSPSSLAAGFRGAFPARAPPRS